MHYRTIAAGIAAVAMLVGCSGAGPAGATPTAGTPAAGATATPTSAVIPTATPAATSTQPVPTTGGVVGTELASRFPTEVDGQPVTNVVVERFIDYLRRGDLPAEEIEAWRSVFSGVGIDLETVIFGSATATVGDDLLGILAEQVPGHDGAELIPVRELWSVSDESQVLSQETVGGKNVMVVRSQDGYPSTWMYADGDVLWSIHTSGPDEAEAFFSAL